MKGKNSAGIHTTGNIDIRVVLKNLTYYLDWGATTEKVKGKWEFGFVASGSESDTYALALDYGFNIGDEVHFGRVQIEYGQSENFRLVK